MFVELVDDFFGGLDYLFVEESAGDECDGEHSMPRRTAWVTLIVPRYKTTTRVIRALMRLIIEARMMK